MSPTDRHMVNDLLSGLNGDIRVSPITVSGTEREELPGDGISNQLHRRKTILVQNTSSGTVWLGDQSVGYGASYGGGDSTTCSGFRLEAGDVFVSDLGRARLYAFNEEAYDVAIKILEIS